jgi:hypothetical protein
MKEIENRPLRKMKMTSLPLLLLPKSGYEAQMEEEETNDEMRGEWASAPKEVPLIHPPKEEVVWPEKLPIFSHPSLPYYFTPLFPLIFLSL